MPTDSPTYEQLLGDYEASFPEKSRQLQALLTDLQNSETLQEDLRSKIHQFAHRLSGSAPMYGFTELYSAANTLKELTQAPDQSNKQNTCALLETLIKALENPVRP